MMKKNILTALLAAVLTITMTTFVIRAYGLQEHPTFSGDTLQEYIENITSSGETETVYPEAENDLPMIRFSRTNDVPIEAQQYLEEVYQAHFEHDRAGQIISKNEIQEYVFRDLVMTGLDYTCAEGEDKVHVLFLVRRDGTDMCTAVILYQTMPSNVEDILCQQYC
ncbi:MAG: hypothetical protein IKE28_09295 [Solobacterium sp.]|nr:hypothetical protein [Solobacterium sp.]